MEQFPRMTQRDLLMSDIEGKDVLARADFDVVVNEKGEPADTMKLWHFLGTWVNLDSRRCKRLIIISHYGDPQGRPNEKYSLRFLVPHLEKVLATKVVFVPDCLGPIPQDEKGNNDKPVKVFLLENLRFHPEEQGWGVDENGNRFECTPEQIKAFRDKIASLGQIFVNDAFSMFCHPSTTCIGMPHAIKCVGASTLKEFKDLRLWMGQPLEKEEPERPRVAIVGGYDVDDACGLLTSLCKHTKTIWVVGPASASFIAAQGKKVGSTKVEKVDQAKAALDECAKNQCTVHLPIDYVCANKEEPSDEAQVCKCDAGIPDGWFAMDIGEATQGAIHDAIKSVGELGHVLLTGVAGRTEWERYQDGTKAICESLSKLRADDNVHTVLASDEVFALSCKWKLNRRFCFASTGGETFRLFIQGKPLPGLEDVNEIPQKRKDQLAKQQEQK